MKSTNGANQADLQPDTMLVIIAYALTYVYLATNASTLHDTQVAVHLRICASHDASWCSLKCTSSVTKGCKLEQ